MELVEISEDQLNRFVGGQNFSQFLQSWKWGEFQEKSGFEILRLGAETERGMVGVATLIKKNLGMGKSYFYCPRGPVINFQFSISNFQTISNELILKYQKVLFFLFKEVEKIARKEKAIFLRFEPGIRYPLSQPKADPPRADIIHYPITKTIDVQPAKTIILDLAKTEEELLKAMHHKTRYNIRLAEKKGVKAYIASIDKFDEFWELMEETVKRDKFRLHKKEHYLNMLKINKDSVKLFLAEFKGKIIAGNIIIFFGDTAVYVHGASSNNHRNVMAPYALQWQVIKSAWEKGFKYYDFYGIDAEKWPGVTRFKKGFGGEEVSYPGTFDFVINKKWYAAYKFFKKRKEVGLIFIENYYKYTNQLQIYQFNN